MSVNVSSKQFARDDFLSELRECLALSGIDPAQLRLEITESAIERSEHIVARISAIRSLGVALDIDDFGGGYSSLRALQHLTADALKIDASFVAALDSANGSVLVETIVNLGHKLGLLTIAEGIETRLQRDLLGALGCDYGQGFLFAPALDAREAGSFAGLTTPSNRRISSMRH